MNDVFGVVNTCTGVSYFKLQIYNRWNELLFESDKESEKWSSLYKSAEQQVDNYVYVLSYRQNNQDYYKKGTFTLLR